MEIQKIFSSYDDYGYEDERLYSVLMDEDELRMFASVQAIMNKASKNKWVQKQGAKSLMNRGVKPKGDIKLLKEGRREIGSNYKIKSNNQIYEDFPLDQKINFKADMFEDIYPRGKSKNARFGKYRRRLHPSSSNSRRYGNLRDVVGLL